MLNKSYGIIKCGINKMFLMWCFITLYTLYTESELTPPPPQYVIVNYRPVTSIGFLHVKASFWYYDVVI